MSKHQIGMTGRSRTPPKGDVRPAGSKRPKAADRRKAREREAAIAALPDAEPEVRRMLDEAIGNSFVGAPENNFGRPEPNLVKALNTLLKDSDGSTQKVVDTASLPAVESLQKIAGTETIQQPVANPEKENKMTLTKSGTSKNGKAAFYKGAASTLRISNIMFPNKTAPDAIEIADGVFAAAKPAKVKMTAEERKAAQAAKPKPTLAEKIAAREKALEALKAKAAAEAQPSL